MFPFRTLFPYLKKNHKPGTLQHTCFLLFYSYLEESKNNKSDAAESLVAPRVVSVAHCLPLRWQRCLKCKSFFVSEPCAICAGLQPPWACQGLDRCRLSRNKCSDGPNHHLPVWQLPKSQNSCQQKVAITTAFCSSSSYQLLKYLVGE